MLPRYYIEVVVFSYSDGVGGSGESFEPRPDPLAMTLDATTTQEQPNDGPVAVYTDRPEEAQLGAVPEEQTTNADESATEAAADEFRFELLESASMGLITPAQCLLLFPFVQAPCGCTDGPTDAPVDPTEAPEDPTDAPVEPTDAPVEPTDAPVDAPTDAPEDPTPSPTDPAPEPTDEPADCSTIGTCCFDVIVILWYR